MVQWLRCHTSYAGGVGSIPGRGTRIPTYHAAFLKRDSYLLEIRMEILTMKYI